MQGTYCFLSAAATARASELPIGAPVSFSSRDPMTASIASTRTQLLSAPPLPTADHDERDLSGWILTTRSRPILLPASFSLAITWALCLDALSGANHATTCRTRIRLCLDASTAHERQSVCCPVPAPPGPHVLLAATATASPNPNPNPNPSPSRTHTALMSAASSSNSDGGPRRSQRRKRHG